MSASKLQNGNEDDKRHEISHWTKAVMGLKITKVSISGYITKQIQNFMLQWTKEELEHLPHFFEQVHNICYQKGKKEWKIGTSCKICPDIFEKVLRLQHNPKSAKLVWNPDVDNTQPKYVGSKLIKKKHIDDRCNICNMENCIFYAERKGIDLQERESFDSDLAKGHTKKALDSVCEYYWRIGNMFMFRGKEKNSMKNTSPADTDPALVFKMMKNCNLFEEDDELYDEVLGVRNLLMHSSNQMVPQDDFDNCIEVFTEFLTNFEKKWPDCYYGKRELDKLLTLPELRVENIKLSTLYEEASNIQKQALTFDIHVSGRFGLSVYDLQSILNVNESRNGNPDPGQHAQTRSMRAEVLTAAVHGSFYGPPGAILAALSCRI